MNEVVSFPSTTGARAGTDLATDRDEGLTCCKDNGLEDTTEPTPETLF